MIGPMPYFRTIGYEESEAVAAAIRNGPLSGYLGGELRGGVHVEALEAEFAALVGSRHAIALNSCTSGLLVACMAVGVGLGTKVVTTPYTMSATAAMPKFLGADVEFGDIENQTFGLDPSKGCAPFGLSTVIVTNLFGHPARVSEIVDDYTVIEDNAQAIFAMEGNKYAGTIGDIGCFSFNVHKHINAGEGGICVTDNDDLADHMRRFRNHAELFDGSTQVGLNLRMSEVSAAIVLAQLARREQIISSRVELAEEMTAMVKGIPGLRAPVVREGCKHVYYAWPLLIDHDRDWLVQKLNHYGIPMKAGYVEPLYRLPAFKQDAHCPVVEDVQRKIALFEICTHDPTALQRSMMWDVFRQVGEEYCSQAI